MGNLCSKSANKPDDADHFAGPGRRLGGGASTGTSSAGRTTQPIPTSVSAPATQPVPAVPTTQGRTLAEGSSATTSSDPRTAAARAAEERNKPKQGGKLATQLNADRNKTMKQHLNEAVNAKVDARNADDNARLQAWN